MSSQQKTNKRGTSFVDHDYFVLSADVKFLRQLFMQVHAPYCPCSIHPRVPQGTTEPCVVSREKCGRVTRFLILNPGAPLGAGRRERISQEPEGHQGEPGGDRLDPRGCAPDVLSRAALRVGPERLQLPRHAPTRPPHERCGDLAEPNTVPQALSPCFPVLDRRVRPPVASHGSAPHFICSPPRT